MTNLFFKLIPCLKSPGPSLGANKEALSIKGVRTRQDVRRSVSNVGTISCTRKPLAGAGAGGEEEAGAGVDRLLLVVEGEVVAACVFLAARLAR